MHEALDTVTEVRVENKRFMVFLSSCQNLCQEPAFNRQVGFISAHFAVRVTRAALKAPLIKVFHLSWVAWSTSQIHRGRSPSGRGGGEGGGLWTDGAARTHTGSHTALTFNRLYFSCKVKRAFQSALVQLFVGTRQVTHHFHFLHVRHAIHVSVSSGILKSTMANRTTPQSPHVSSRCLLTESYIHNETNHFKSQRVHAGFVFLNVNQDFSKNESPPWTASTLTPHTLLMEWITSLLLVNFETGHRLHPTHFSPGATHIPFYLEWTGCGAEHGWWERRYFHWIKRLAEFN